MWTQQHGYLSTLRLMGTLAGGDRALAQASGGTEEMDDSAPAAPVLQLELRVSRRGREGGWPVVTKDLGANSTYWVSL